MSKFTTVLVFLKCTGLWFLEFPNWGLNMFSVRTIVITSTLSNSSSWYLVGSQSRRNQLFFIYFICAQSLHHPLIAHEFPPQHACARSQSDAIQMNCLWLDRDFNTFSYSVERPVRLTIAVIGSGNCNLWRRASRTRGCLSQQNALAGKILKDGTESIGQRACHKSSAGAARNEPLFIVDAAQCRGGRRS